MSPFQPSVFISIPVSDLPKSIAFYQAIGLTKSPQMADSSGGAWMVLSETFSIMLISHEKWKELTPRTIPDARKSAQFGLSMVLESRRAVEEWLENGAKAGGVKDPNPIDDYEFMYGRSLEDPDGHLIEAKWMDMSKMAYPSA